MVIKSDAARAWVDTALLQIPAHARQGVGGPKDHLCITFWITYASNLPDLSSELILDTLQKAGVIKDDRYVFEKHEYKTIDRNNPGVEILIEPL